MNEQMKGFPVRCKQFAFNIDGIRTEFVLNLYSNKIFVIVTQRDKIASYVRNEEEI